MAMRAYAVTLVCLAATGALIVADTAGCRPPPEPETAETGRILPSVNLRGERILLVLPQHNCPREVYDAFATTVTETGGALVVASNVAGTVTLSGGGNVEAAISHQEAVASDYAALVLFGVRGVGGRAQTPELLELAREFESGAKVIGAMQGAQKLLADGGMLRGRVVAGAEGSDEDLTAAGASISDESVVVDGRFVTARSPRDSMAFAAAVVTAVGR